jgi:hypothetical protein
MQYKVKRKYNDSARRQTNEKRKIPAKRCGDKSDEYSKTPFNEDVG